MTADVPTTFATRHDGWTMARQLDFLESLAATGNVATAAASVGKSASSAYRLRGRLEGDLFGYGWKAALAMAYHRLRELALERIETGVPAATVYKGEVVSAKTVFSDRLLIAMLDHLKPPAPAPAPGDRPADPARDYAATIEAFDAGIAGGFDPHVPFSGGGCPHGCKPPTGTMTREEFIAVIRSRPKSIDLEQYASSA